MLDKLKSYLYGDSNKSQGVEIAKEIRFYVVQCGLLANVEESV